MSAAVVPAAGGPADRSPAVPSPRRAAPWDEALGTLLGGHSARALAGPVELARHAVPVDVPAAYRFRSGDLTVEAWPGDDQDDGPLREAASALSALLARAVDAGSGRDELVAALVETQNQLLSVYSVARIQAADLTPDELDAELVRLVQRLTKASAAAIVTPDRVQGHGDRDDLARLTDRLAGWGSGPADERIRFSDAGRHGLIWPLDGVLGGPAGLAVVRGVPVDTSLTKLMAFLAGTVTSARNAARLHQEALRQVAIRQEHDAASRLAQASLPGEPPRLPGCEVVECTVPARSAGGDFYAHAVAHDALLFAVGDVAGKGLPAALVMSKIISGCRAAFSRNSPERLRETMRELADELFPYLSDVGLFATVLLGGYVPSTGALHLYNAGHSPTLLVDGRRTTVVPASAPPLGVVPGIRGDVVEFRLREGDLLVVGSDGLAEQEDSTGAMFGYDRVLAEADRLRGRPAREVADTLQRLVAEHGQGVPPTDDQTLFVLRHGAAGAATDGGTDAGTDDGTAGGGGPAPGAEVTVDATHLAIRRLGGWLAGLCGGLPEAEALLPRCELALQELCVNVVDHGYRSGAGASPGTIRVRGWLGGGELRIEVRDDGVAFDRSAVTPPSPGRPQVHGYGLMLIDQLVDRFGYERRGAENVWELVVRWESS